MSNASGSHRVAVTLVSGWHGSASSSLADRLASELVPQAVAVVRSEEEVVEHAPGCQACAMRYDLVRVVTDLASRRERPDRILVDVGGWSDVVVAAQTFLKDPDLRRRTELRGVVTAVDTPSAAVRVLAGRPGWPTETCGEQVAAADHVVLTSTGGTTPDGLEAARRVLRETNPHARVWDERSLRPEAVLAGGSFGWAAASATEDVRPDPAAGGGMTASTVVMEAPGDLDAGLLHGWIKGLHHLEEGRLLRIRGVVGLAGADRRLLCQGAGTYVDFEHGRAWDAAVPATRLLVAGRALEPEELRSSLQECRVG